MSGANRDWKADAKATWATASKDNLSLISAGVAYYAFLAMVPLLGAAVLIYGLVIEPAAVAAHVNSLAETLPPAVAKLIGGQLEAVSEASGGTKGLGLLVALAISLYGARNGAGAVMTGLDIAYGCEDDRSFLRRNLLALGITVAAILGIGAVAAAIGVTGMLGSIAGSIAGHVLVLAAGVAGALLLYRVAPDFERTPDWHALLPGSLLFGFGWTLLTVLFTLYVTNFASYNATYGSLGAVVALLTWLYFSAYVLLLGGVLNSVRRAAT